VFSGDSIPANSADSQEFAAVAPEDIAPEGIGQVGFAEDIVPVDTADIAPVDREDNIPDIALDIGTQPVYPQKLLSR
jgi:hypothetical protein